MLISSRSRPFDRQASDGFQVYEYRVYQGLGLLCFRVQELSDSNEAVCLPGFVFKDGIKFRSNRLDDVSQVFERCRKVVVWLSLLFQEGRQVFLGVIEGNVWCEEADTLTSVGVDELPNASPQDGANKDVRIENDHLSGMRPSRGGAAP
jgi:hypothetical protein